MGRFEFISGPNFSGRSAALRETMQRNAAGDGTFYIGPYAEAALSGLTSTVRDEVLLYRNVAAERPVFPLPVGDEALLRDPQSLSGGEQVLLALHCFSQSAYRHIAIDTALEQLDPGNRRGAFDYVALAAESVTLIDNRDPPDGWTVLPQEPFTKPAFAIDWPKLAELIEPHAASGLSISGLNFKYRNGKSIFENARVTLEPGRAYRVSGVNGAGKTTLFKLLVGALVPGCATMTLGNETYRPWRDGNRALSLATQNPDQQWCGATLAEDIARRCKALTAHPHVERIDAQRVQALAAALGAASLDTHLYELPLAARKRLSWTWPFAGVHPWVMLDEPTVGQDRATRENLAQYMTLMCARGYGVMFVTHDDEFAAQLPHRVLTVADRALRLT